MARVIGVGGLFFKADDPEKLYQWYETHLGVKREGSEAVTFTDGGPTVWAIFPKSTGYFSPSRAPFMMNFRVDDLDALLSSLREAGVEIDPHREDYDYGRFAWIADPEGNRLELWQASAKPASGSV